MIDTRVVVLTGAGISAESGIRTFRDQDGLWENHHIEEVATYEAYLKDPTLVHRFYNARRNQLFEDSVQPNPAHKALKKMADALGDDFFLVTQNVDDLHDRTGTECIHMHGELLKARCEACNTVFNNKDELSTDSKCPECSATGQVRPHIVWFGESPLFMSEIYDKLDQATDFLSIGTSGLVYPAAQFVQQAKRYGKAHCVEFNLHDTPQSLDFDEHIQGPAGETLPEWVDQFLINRGL